MSALLYPVQGLSIGKISIVARPRENDWLVDEVKAMQNAGVNVLVSCLTPFEQSELGLEAEAECCEHQNIVYCSFPIRDFDVPPFTRASFDLIEQLYAQLSQGKHIALHCRQGLGRSVLVAASVLVLAGFTPEQAFEALSSARGYDVPETDEQRAWVKRLYQQRTRI